MDVDIMETTTQEIHGLHYCRCADPRRAHCAVCDEDYCQRCNGRIIGDVKSTAQPDGWQVRQHWLAGDRPDTILCDHKSLTWVRRLVSTLTDERDAGDCDYFIEPVGGWSALAGNPLAALLHHVAAGDVSPDAALAEIRKLTAQSASVVENDVR